MTDEERVTRHLARLMYLVYCDRRGERPYRPGYVPAWALDYAEAAVEYLGFDDSAVQAVDDAAVVA